MKKVIPDPPIETVLPLKGAHRQVALEYILKCIQKNNRSSVIEIDNLCKGDYGKVMREVDKIVQQLQKKVDKIKGVGN